MTKQNYPAAEQTAAERHAANSVVRLYANRFYIHNQGDVFTITFSEHSFEEIPPNIVATLALRRSDTIWLRDLLTEMLSEQPGQSPLDDPTSM